MYICEHVCVYVCICIYVTHICSTEQIQRLHLFIPMYICVNVCEKTVEENDVMNLGRGQRDWREKGVEEQCNIFILKFNFKRLCGGKTNSISLLLDV